MGKQMPTVIYSKRDLLTIRDMMRDLPYMQPYRNASEYHEVIRLLGDLGTTSGDEAVIRLED
jgi:hypothetical protein